MLFSFCLLAAGVSAVQGQTNLFSTNVISATIRPPSDTIFVEQTTNAIFVTLDSLSFTNLTNISVSGTFQGQALSFLDNGTSPDATANDGTFSASLVAPSVNRLTAIPLDISIEAIDPNGTNDLGQVTNVPLSTNLTVTYQIAPRPPNDNFANAIRVPSSGGVLVASNNYATLEAGEPYHAQVPTSAASLWWMWSSPVATNVLVDTAGSSFDPVLAVYTGETLTSLAPVASATNDVLNGLKAHLNFEAAAGVTYRIAVAGLDAFDVGTVFLRVVPGGHPDIVGPSVTILTPTNNAVVTNGVMDLTGMARDNGPDDTGVRQVFVQVNGGKAQPLGGTTNWNGRATLDLGTNVVSVYATDVAGNEGAPDSIEVLYLNPLNDAFANAIELTNALGVATADTTLATKEPGEPNHAGNDGGHSIWYRWRAPSNGRMRLSTTNSSFDTLLAVYVGESLTNLTLVASNDDVTPGSGYSGLSFQAASNQVYRIAVDGYGGASGAASLTYDFSNTDPTFTLAMGPSGGGSVSAPAGQYLTGTKLILAAVPDRDYEFVGWTGTVQTAQNPILLYITNSVDLLPLFRPIHFTDTFESGGFQTLPWSFGGEAPWQVESATAAEGAYAVRSGVIGNNQQSLLLLDITTRSGTGSFAYRVSSEKGWDFLEFYVNGNRVARWSGETGWRELQFPLDRGSNKLEWRYVKDANHSAGLDAAFLDDLYVPLDVPDTNNPAALLRPLRLSTGEMVIWLKGQSQRSYRVEDSSDLVEWQPISTNRLKGDVGFIVDSSASNAPARYYRALSP